MIGKVGVGAAVGVAAAAMAYHVTEKVERSHGSATGPLIAYGTIGVLVATDGVAKLASPQLRGLYGSIGVGGGVGLLAGTLLAAHAR